MAGGGFTRRRTLMAGGAMLTGALWSLRAGAGQKADRAGLDQALASSDLIYVTPLRRDGRESTCQSEVWFVAEGRDVYVVTAHDAWRARAVKRGRTRARVWVGDVGVWKRSGGAYRKLPGMEVRGEMVADAAVHQRVLGRYGDKYSLEWLMWGPRFRSGLAEGSRVMLHYAPA
jgi:hypothetical protein